jgi:hypothetical protein
MNTVHNFDSCLPHPDGISDDSPHLVVPGMDNQVDYDDGVHPQLPKQALELREACVRKR